MKNKIILKKIYNLPVKIKPNNYYNISDDMITSAIEEYNKREHKALVIFDKNKQPKILNVEVKELTRNELTISCNDKNTITFLDKYPKASAIVAIIPNDTILVKRSDGYHHEKSISVFDIYYLPIDPEEIINYGKINKS